MRKYAIKVKNTLFWGKPDISSFREYKQNLKDFYSRAKALPRMRSCVPEIVASSLCVVADVSMTKVAIQMGFTEKNPLQANIMAFCYPLSWVVAILGAMSVSVLASYVLGKWSCRLIFLFYFFIMSADFVTLSLASQGRLTPF